MALETKRNWFFHGIFLYEFIQWFWWKMEETKSPWNFFLAFCSNICLSLSTWDLRSLMSLIWGSSFFTGWFFITWVREAYLRVLMVSWYALLDGDTAETINQQLNRVVQENLTSAKVLMNKNPKMVPSLHAPSSCSEQN